MAFVVVQPELLSAAAADLQGIGSAVHGQCAAVAGPTTAVAPPASDTVSTLIATRFSAHGTVFQSVSAQAAAIHQMFVAALSSGATSYASAEALNAVAAS